MPDIKITDIPISNYDAMCNFCRYVDGRVKFIRTKTGDDNDVYVFCRKSAKKNAESIFPQRTMALWLKKYVIIAAELIALFIYFTQSLYRRQNCGSISKIKNPITVSLFVTGDGKPYAIAI